MSVLIFKLNDVSDEEADAVRQLLADNELDFYESSAGRWGVSIAGLWLKDESQKARARALIEAYQVERVASLRTERGDQPMPGLIDRFKAAPLQVSAMGLLLLMVLYVSIAPFLGWL
ncbi:DUF6164 family protein [Dasania sp. GY-MA-18]|uniref:DUF6164 family protein n=1 Tax=Dasania phycosphaerae TaxID=2950436 RepID=A0A9J6RKK1_9GAMM|nr:MULTISPECIES: DUF6164 family protein [Dasania]MCR8922598.1 DUF6164 family protein [Dasania sp. GY-MA-18]MCZ0865027.1 DUF6164 family protein [Dasania phycosphaerae]MCZ0868754.1 DUF6164 family protein [Dasania phycosphaerae]